MIHKKILSLATTLLTVGTNIAALTLLQLPSSAETVKIKHDNSSANQSESNNLNLVASFDSQINFSIPSSTQVAHRGHRVYSGKASWYGPGFHGRRTANGEIYNSNALTAAHRSLPFGTRVRVTNIHNGRSVVVRINDRGPFIGGRIIDVSAGAARRLNMISSGIAPVRLEILGR